MKYLDGFSPTWSNPPPHNAARSINPADFFLKLPYRWANYTSFAAPPRPISDNALKYSEKCELFSVQQSTVLGLPTGDHLADTAGEEPAPVTGILTVLYCTVLYCTVLYCTVLYCTVLYCIVLYCTLMYWLALSLDPGLTPQPWYLWKYLPYFKCYKEHCLLVPLATPFSL